MEILFRGKTEDARWVFGDLFHDKDCFGNITHSWIYEYDKNHGRQFQSEVIPETVGQYTGHNDRNGNRIFVGDFVLVKDGIRYGENYECVGTILVEDIRTVGLEDYTELEVIGNIHDNPELLDG